MNYQVHYPSADTSRPGQPLCLHRHPTIHSASASAQETASPTGQDPVIYDLETDLLLDPFEIEAAHRQDPDDCVTKAEDQGEDDS